METTVRIFDDDAYKRTFRANVLACDALKRDGTEYYQVVLDQTIFFPEGGGQSPDQGTIHGLQVIDVQIKEEIITHTLKAPIPVGTEVEGVLDGTIGFPICSSIAENIFFRVLFMQNTDITMLDFT